MEPDGRPVPIEFEVKVNRVHGSLRMTIPKEIAKALTIREGDVVLVGVNDSNMTVKKRSKQT
jgi:AbrB family looped-hinge helix DNA binding protein